MSVNNQRLSERFKISMEVEVAYPNGSIYHYMTRDVGDGGVYILMPKEDFPPLGEIVAIQKASDESCKTKLSSDVAVVVHTGSDGIGLAFVDIDLL